MTAPVGPARSVVEFNYNFKGNNAEVTGYFRGIIDGEGCMDVCVLVANVASRLRNIDQLGLDKK